MQLAIDVKYNEENNTAKAVGVLFNWQDNHAKEIICKELTSIQKYVSGQFYKRELPCIMAIVNQISTIKISTIIIDGHVFVDNTKKYGLGGYVWEKTERKIPVIGVAKRSFYANSNTVKEIYRGRSKKPLYISSIGIDVDIAAHKIKNMKGTFRIPTILKQVDTITRLNDEITPL